MTTRLRLVCHASTEAVRASAFPADEPLDLHGLKKLAGLTHRLGDADRCWTSPALRARQTAEALSLEASTEPALRECDYGRWAGRTLEEVQAETPEAIAAWLGDIAAAPHGGETLLTLMGRVAAWLDGQVGFSGSIVAVTHASVIRAAIIHAIGAPPGSFWRIDVAPLAVVNLNGGNGRWTLASLGMLPSANRSSPCV